MEAMKLLTIPEAAAILNVTEARAYELVRLGILPACRLGRQLRIDQAQLQEWIRNGGKGLSGGWKN